MKRKSAWVAALLVIVSVVAAGLIYCFAPKRGAPRANNHWAFIAPEQKVPVIGDAAWVRNPIDAFVLARLRTEKIKPAPEADRTVLIRRLSLDLTGLPPTPAKVDDFVRDGSAQAYERVVDRLLASPHFGEKWARHWLDLARYADSDGYEQDWLRKYAFNYRDWVIRAINADLPMDQFTVRQIAGDLLPNAGREEQTATGFHCQTLLNREPGTDAEEFRCKEVADRVNTTATAWLGLSVACAECHDHPHDPITQKEYYQLYAFFNNADLVERAYHDDAELATIRAQRDAWIEKSNSLAKAIAAAAGPVCANLQREFMAHLETRPTLPRANKIAILAEREQERRDTHLHVRGDFLRKGDKVKPAALGALHPFKARKRQPDRLDLALWLVDAQNPLTARVMVNQTWAHLFGRGLVSTPDDFGVYGAKPSHPELLDWLAVELRRLGWSRKQLIKLIVSSAAYRQSSQTRPELTDRDPENVLLARQNRFRLSAEDIRDSHLAVSGMLQYRIGGPSFRPPMPADVAAISFGYDGPMQQWKDGPLAEQYRRSLFVDMNGLKGLFIIGLTLCCIVAKTTAAHDLEQDYSTTSNPTGVWSYGWKGTISGQFNLFTYHGYEPGENFDYWLKDPSGPSSVYHNPRTNTIRGFAPGDVWVGGGYEGNPDNFGVVRFTAPASGFYKIETTVRPFIDSGAGDTDFHVAKNNSELYGVFLVGNAPPTTYSNIVGLAAGDTVDLMVSRGADGREYGSALKIKAQITSTDPPPPPPPLPDCVPAADGLVAWWPLDRSGEDVAGNNDGTLLGNPAFADGKVGAAMQFDYSDDAVRVPANSALDVGQGAGFTIEGWIKPNDLSVQHPIVEWNDDNGTIGAHFWTSHLGFNGQIASLAANIVDVNGVGHDIRTGADLLTTERFHHVALTYDKASGVAQIYIDGTRRAEVNMGSFSPQTSSHFYLGLRSSGTATGNRFAGAMDEISLYNRALSEAELQGIYSASGSGKCKPPPTAPVITVQPEDRTVSVGDSVTFTVTASGSQPFTYQWRHDGANLAGATQRSLTLSNVQPSDAGAYSVVVANAVGSDTSRDAVLTVIEATDCTRPPHGLVAWWPFDGSAEDVAGDNDGTLLGEPTFTAGKVGPALHFDYHNDAMRVPANRALDVGDGQGFTVEGWIKSDELTVQHPIVEWNDDMGGIGAHFWTSHLGFNGQLASLAANIVDVNGMGHDIRTEPDLLTTDRFHHVALTYDQRSGMGAIYVDGARVVHKDMGKFKPQTSSHFYVGYRSSGTAAGNRFAGRIDELSLYDRALHASDIQAIYVAGNLGKCKPEQPLRIVSQPQSQTVFAGADVQFSVVAEGDAPLSYQWRFGGTAIAGATASTLLLEYVQPAHAGSYSVVVSNPNGSIASAEAVLTVISEPDGDYNLERDYSEVHNPAGVWSYGWKGTIDGAFHLFTHHGYEPGENFDYWLKDPSGPSSVYHNPRTNTIRGFAPGAVWIGPGYEGNPDNFVAVRFTVPPGGAGTYRIESIVQPFIMGIGDTDFHVTRNGVELFGRFLSSDAPPTVYSNTLSLAAGDTIDFLVGRGADGREYGSALKIKAFISLVDSEPPGEQVEIRLSPQVIFSSDQPHPFVIAPDGRAALVTLQAVVPSHSGGLAYAWFANGNETPFSREQTTVNTADAGTHSVTLVVSGAVSGRASLTFLVVTPGEAVAAILELLRQYELPNKEERPLAAALMAAIREFERGDLKDGADALEAFQEKVAKRLDSEQAAALIEAAQKVIDAVTADEDDE